LSDEKPSIGERYAIALTSSHLEWSNERRTALDFLLAMGCVRDGDGRETMGSMLMRLMHEFAQIKGEYSNARRQQARMLLAAKEVRDPLMAAAIEVLAEDEAIAAHQHIRLKIPSLAATQRAFTNWCMIQAGKRGFMTLAPMPTDRVKFKTWRQSLDERNRTIGLLAGKVLDVFMEPTCIRCSGRGFSGGYSGTIQTKCNTRGGCGGSGRRDLRHIGNSSLQHDFSYYLYCQAEHLLTHVEIELAKKMRDDTVKA